MKTLGSRVGTLDTRAAPLAAKEADAELNTAEHKAWRLTVCRRAGWCCEQVVDGKRCANAAPKHRMYADHVTERQDGGALYDPANGLCRCASHHVLKTNAVRAARQRQGVGEVRSL